MAATNSSTAASPGTGRSNGHQNSTASNPADRAAAGRCSRGSSVNMIEQFARYLSEWATARGPRPADQPIPGSKAGPGSGASSRRTAASISP